MSIIDKLKGCNGTTLFMSKYDIGKPEKKSHRAVDQFLNNIILKFGLEKGIKFTPNNRPGYKGSFNPLVDNGYEVQKHFDEFRTWMNTNYTKLIK
jgi:hypothetical protein